MALRTRVLVLVIVVACLRYCVHCQSPFFPANQQDMLRRGQLITALPGTGAAPRNSLSMLPKPGGGYGAGYGGGYGIYPASSSSPFSQVFGSGLSSPSTLGFLDRQNFASGRGGGGGGGGGSGRIEPFSSSVGGGGGGDGGGGGGGISRKGSSYPSLARNHPFSSIRLNPVPTSKGVSLTRPREDAFERRGRDRFSSLFDTETARKYSLDAPSTFEKPITKTSLPDVNSPIQLDLATDEQKRVAYAKSQGQLPPPRGPQTSQDERRPRLKSVFGPRSLSARRLGPSVNGQGLLDWERPSSLPPMPGHSSPTTATFPSPREGLGDGWDGGARYQHPDQDQDQNQAGDRTEPTERKRPHFDDTAPFLEAPSPSSSSSSSPKATQPGVSASGRAVPESKSSGGEGSPSGKSRGSVPSSASGHSPAQLVAGKPSHRFAEEDGDGGASAKAGVEDDGSGGGAGGGGRGGGRGRGGGGKPSGVGGKDASAEESSPSGDLQPGDIPTNTGSASPANSTDGAPTASPASPLPSRRSPPPLPSLSSSPDSRLKDPSANTAGTDAGTSGSSSDPSGPSADLADTEDSGLQQGDEVVATVDQAVDALKALSQGGDLLEHGLELPPPVGDALEAALPSGAGSAVLDLNQLDARGTSPASSSLPGGGFEDAAADDVNLEKILDAAREATDVTFDTSAGRDGDFPAAPADGDYYDSGDFSRDAGADTGFDLPDTSTSSAATTTTLRDGSPGASLGRDSPGQAGAGLPAEGDYDPRSSGESGGGADGPEYVTKGRETEGEGEEEEGKELGHHERGVSLEDDGIPPDRQPAPFETGIRDGHYTGPSDQGTARDPNSPRLDTSQGDYASSRQGTSSQHPADFPASQGEESQAPPPSREPATQSDFRSPSEERARQELGGSSEDSPSQAGSPAEEDSPQQKGFPVSPTEDYPPQRQPSDLVSFENDVRPTATRSGGPVIAENIGGSQRPSRPPSSPFEMMFGKSLKQAYEQTFGSLFGSLNKAPSQAGALFGGGGGGGLSGPQGFYGQQGQGGGFGEGPADFGGFGGNGVYSPGKQLFDTNVNGIVNKRPSLRLFGNGK